MSYFCSGLILCAIWQLKDVQWSCSSLFNLFILHKILKLVDLKFSPTHVGLKQMESLKFFTLFFEGDNRIFSTGGEGPREPLSHLPKIYSTLPHWEKSPTLDSPH